MEQFITLIVIAGLSVLTNYLNKKAERDQQNEARKLQEKSGKLQRPENRPSMAEAQSQPSVASEKEPALTDWSTWKRTAEDRSIDMGQTPDTRNIAPHSSSGIPKPETREGHSPVRRFWDELNDVAKEWSESMAPASDSAPKPPPPSLVDSSKATIKVTEIQKTAAAKANLKSVEQRKEQSKRSKNQPQPINPWALSGKQEKRSRSLAKAMLKKPSTARQAVALSLILAPPKALSPEEDNWFSR